MTGGDSSRLSTALKWKPPVRVAVARRTACHSLPSLRPGPGTSDHNNIEKSWVCQLLSVVPGLQKWRQFIYPSVSRSSPPWHSPSSADTFQNLAVTGYHFPGSPTPFHPASRTALAKDCFSWTEGIGHLLQGDGGIELPRGPHIQETELPLALPHSTLSSKSSSVMPSIAQVFSMAFTGEQKHPGSLCHLGDTALAKQN